MENTNINHGRQGNLGNALVAESYTAFTIEWLDKFRFNKKKENGFYVKNIKPYFHISIKFMIYPDGYFYAQINDHTFFCQYQISVEQFQRLYFGLTGTLCQQKK
jgi:hypothetical protein